MKNLSKKILVLALLLIEVLTLFLGACGGGGNTTTEETDTKPVQVKELGYLEDMGHQVVYKDVELEKTLQKSNETAEYYGLEEVQIAPQYFLSGVIAPNGKYKVSFNEKDLGEFDLVDGKIMLSKLPENITLGDKYKVTVTSEKGKPYTQTVRYVSKAIRTKRELFDVLSMYRTHNDVAVSYDANVSEIKAEPVSPMNTESSRFYGGEGSEFKQRFYVLADNIAVTQGDVFVGVGYKESQNKINPAAWLYEQRYRYFYDVFDGQGYFLNFDNINDGGIFGNVGRGAKIMNLGVTQTRTYWTGKTSKSDRKNMIACFISSDTVIENIAMSLTATGSAFGLNLLAPYVGETAVVKDIFIYMARTFSAYTEDEYVSAGYLCHQFFSENAENISVVSPGMKFAGRHVYTERKTQLTDQGKTISGLVPVSVIYYYGENQIEAEFDSETRTIDYVNFNGDVFKNLEVEVSYQMLRGVRFYNSPSDLDNNLIGKWTIDKDGIAIYNG